MAEKTMKVLVCDFPHKSDRPATTSVTIDVCTQHAEVLAGADHKVECPECGNKYAPGAGLAKHRQLSHGVQSSNGHSKTAAKKGA